LISLKKFSKYLQVIYSLFLIHNLFYLFDYSIKGDHFDYVVFSLEYLTFCFTIGFICKILKNIYVKIFRILGFVIMSIGFAIGVFGIILFIVISQSYESNKKFSFVSNNRTYETRRYSFGFPTLAGTRYTFETYRTFKYLPVEKLIDKTDFLDTETNMNIFDDDLKMDILNVKNQKTLIFQSSNGEHFLKTIH